jgi:hypothetical protein
LLRRARRRHGERQRLERFELHRSGFLTPRWKSRPCFGLLA